MRYIPRKMALKSAQAARILVLIAGISTRSQQCVGLLVYWLLKWAKQQTIIC